MLRMFGSTRYARWLDFTVDMVQCADGSFPRGVVADQLADTFDCAVSWNWVDSNGAFGFELREPIPHFPTADEAQLWASTGMSTHPLLRWYAMTGDPTAMSMGRVPRNLVGDEGFGMVAEILGPRGVDQQLSIPYRTSASSHHTFVLARARVDFDERDLDLCRRVQPLLAVLDRHAHALARLRLPTDSPMTRRELAVLHLLRDGLTATAIAHRLLVSPRTVHAHLGSIYRKLGVTDRMRAVLVAQERGLIPLAPEGDKRQRQGLVVAWASAIPARLPDEWARAAAHTDIEGVSPKARRRKSGLLTMSRSAGLCDTQ